MSLVLTRTREHSDSRAKQRIFTASADLSADCGAVFLLGSC